MSIISSIFGGLIIFYVTLKLFCRLTCARYFAKVDMTGKTILITGANGGIGKETAKALATTGARIIMACRNMESAKNAKNDIIAASGNPNVVVKYLDVSSLKSVREFADDINKTEPHLDVLIHNAGYAGAEIKAQSVDGIELTMATNHYGPFLLTHLLIDLLKKSGHSRIVVVGSLLHILGKVDMNNLNPLNVWPAALYYVSKNANALFTLELARRLKGTNVTANFLHPGLIDSGIWRNVPQPAATVIKMMNIFSKTSEEGCQSSVYCAVAPELERVSGQYFVECRKFWLTNAVTDPKRLKEFWEGSIKLCKLTANDAKI